ncbi:HdeD family acid-resistance protein [Scatolibacter rhodanostii]|uniref:HdeD family acid-resistance protein n=1 Tax=Scatolibacter rhodanostii TaxID=2014781 RepID=UPI000C081956|nr:DUF308 domain-containing protein [Scatolibacter rhodanostii]
MQDKNFRSILCMIAGAVLVLFPYSALKWLMVVLGILVLIYGVSCINNKMGTQQTEGIISIVIALVLIILPQFILGLLPTLLGILILMYGITEIQKAFEKKKIGYSRWVVDLIIAVFIVILGVSLITNPFGLIKLLVKIVGVLVIYEGLSPMIRQNKNF